MATKADLLDQAKALGIESVNTKSKVADIQAAIDQARAPVPILDQVAAAEYLGMSVDDLMLSFYRRLPPGSLAVKVDGQLVWRKSDLLVPRPDRSDSPHDAPGALEGEGAGD